MKWVTGSWRWARPMSTADEHTILIVDRQAWSGRPDLRSERVEGKLLQTFQDFQVTSEGPFECNGLPSLRRTFRGVLDGTEWRGLIVHVVHGNTVFDLIGLTSTEMSGFQIGSAEQDH